jgi:hypothetical protein
MVKRMYFFKDSFCFEYDPRPSTDRVVKGPTPITTRLKGLNATFASKIDAALNLGDGFIELFSGDECWRYDALSDKADSPTPQKITTRFPTLPASFKTKLDAAFNSGTGKAYLFRGSEYVRYDLKSDRVDAPDPGTPPYPRGIGDPNGWHGLTPTFQAGIDAAVFAGDGKIYFFKGTEYARLTFATRTVDAISPPYPLGISPLWTGLPATLDAGVEWIQAGAAALKVTKVGCKHVTGDAIGQALLGDKFTMVASIVSTGHPSVCGCAEYRQFVRGSHIRNGARETSLLPNPTGGPKIELLPRPAPGAAEDNFREDGNRGTVLRYGHRQDAPDPFGIYGNFNAAGTALIPDQRSGCVYSGFDLPFISGGVGEAVTVDLDFLGLIIDVAAGDEVLAKETWTITCSGVL